MMLEDIFKVISVKVHHCPLRQETVKTSTSQGTKTQNQKYQAHEKMHNMKKPIKPGDEHYCNPRKRDDRPKGV
jgi:hypothetical protein